jgi:adenylate cyclase class IV/ribosomal protein S18 acetylase RimI-like enzyme
MPRNVEIKARVADPARLRRIAEALGDGPAVEILQDDTFFAGAAGRLKLRAFADGTGELIAYRRADERGPKASHYAIAPVPRADALRATLAAAYGTVGRVRKRRVLVTYGRTRIHLDQVDGLGHFLELEVVLADGEAEDAGVAEAYALMARLGVRDADLVDRAYVDLLAEMAVTIPTDDVSVRRLAPADASAHRALMLDAFARHPDAFTSTAAERAALPLAWWEARLAPGSHEALFGAFAGDGLAGSVGLSFERRARTRHKALLFGMYVAPGHRLRGLGARLLDTALAHARATPGVELVQLTVSERNLAALELYRSRGFVEWGFEPRAVSLGDGHVAKRHLWCDLRG